MQDKLRKILKYYGEEAQAKKSREELSELTIGLIKEDTENIKEEIADVKVMTKQLLMFEDMNLEVYKEWKNYFERMKPENDKERIERTLSVILVVIQERILLEEIWEIGEDIAALEYYLDRYMDINNISKEEIEKEMERKINRQLERIEREKVNDMGKL
ncbi:hypothetical protein [Clostridium baratii]|uniref:hypothetical protein n=1 Tax=Clostridium baratii TaxID=1561 RepID=UPI0030CEB2D2